MTSPVPNLAVHLDSRDALDVRRFQVRQRISSLFEITLTAHSENADVDFDAVVGQPASFSMTGDVNGPVPARVWTGICKHIEQAAAEETGLSTYRITIVPTLWLATQRRNHRMFQQMSELDIVQKLLGEWGIAPELRISSAYPKREYRIQYGESDFAFLCRMLEEAGISFYFEQADAGTKLVLCDAPQSSERRAPIAFRDRASALAIGREYVTNVHVGQRVRPGRYTMRDRDTRLPAAYPLLATADAGGGVESKLERFHYAPGAFQFGTDQGEGTPHADDKGATRTNEKEGGALARKRLEAKRASAKVCTFETNAVDLAPGVVMSMLDHPRSDLGDGQRLLVVEATHEGIWSGEWSHRCEVLRGDLAFRPPLSMPKPRISGVENATVVGPAGQEIHTDELGRVRVHFHWDRESRMNEDSSCWIHVSQPWGGAGYGGTNLPRIGQEVLVDFLGGDPDRPVITGRVYTSVQTTPYQLPDNKTQSGWKSSSSPVTGGYNEIMFEDAAGRELVRMQAEKDLHKLVKNDEQVTIGHDRTKLVQNDDAITVGNDRTKIIQNDENSTIGNDRTKLVQANERHVVGQNRSRTVGINENVNIGVSHSVSVGADQSVDIGTDHNLNVGADQSIDIGGDHSTDVGGDHSTDVGGDQSLDVAGDQDIDVAGDHALNVAGDATVTIGGAKTLSTGDAYTITVGDAMSTTVTADQTETVGATKTVTVTDKIEMICGKAKVTMESAGKITWAIDGGASIVLDDKNVIIKAGGGGTVVIQGGPDVHINP